MLRWVVLKKAAETVATSHKLEIDINHLATPADSQLISTVTIVPRIADLGS